MNNVYVKFARNNKDRGSAKHKNNEGWMLNASLNKRCNQHIQIKKSKDKHTCFLELLERYATYKTVERNIQGPPYRWKSGLRNVIGLVGWTFMGLDFG